MRVSTTTVFEQGIFNIQRAQALLIRGQEQISTGRRVLTPADDPVAAARALEVSQSKAINEQYARNGRERHRGHRPRGERALALHGAAAGHQDARGQRGRRRAHVERPEEPRRRNCAGVYAELLGVANSTDGNGLYLFSGYQGATQAFTENSPGAVTYNGDQGQRLIQIGASRQIAVSDAGSDIFQRIRTGNGVFETSANAANTGGGIVTRGVVRDQAAWDAAGNPQNFEVRFFVDSTNVPPVTTYDIVDTVNNVSLTTGAAPGGGPFLRTYQDGASIVLARQAPPDTNPTAFDYGIDLSVTGEPATGDAFTVAPSVNEDIFATRLPVDPRGRDRRAGRHQQHPARQCAQLRAEQHRQRARRRTHGSCIGRCAREGNRNRHQHLRRPGPPVRPDARDVARSRLRQGDQRPHVQPGSRWKRRRRRSSRSRGCRCSTSCSDPTACQRDRPDPEIARRCEKNFVAAR